MGAWYRHSSLSGSRLVRMRVFAALVFGLLLHQPLAAADLPAASVATTAVAPGDPAAGQAAQRKGVLILSGTQYGLSFKDGLIVAILDSLKGKGISANDIFVENLDLARNDTPHWRDMIAAMLRDKLTHVQTGLVIAVNHGALQFLAQQGHDLVPPGTPVITVAAQLARVAWHGEPRAVINIAKLVDLDQTIRYGLELFPRTRRLFLVTSADDRQFPFHDMAAQAFAALPGQLQVEDSRALTHEQMLERVATLPPDSLVLQGIYLNDRTGRSFVPAEVAAAVARRANAPVLGLYEAHLRVGLTGGSVVSSAAVGQRVGQIATELLSGTRRIDRAEAEVNIAPQPMFDWEQLERWGTDPARLPAGALFLNRPGTIWNDYRAAVLVAAVAFLLLSAALLALLLMNHRRKQMASTLRESEQRLHLAAEGAQFGVVELDFVKGSTFWSKEFRQLIGVSADMPATPPDRVLDCVHPDDRAALQDRLRHQMSAQGDGIVDDFFRIMRPDGELRWLRIRGQLHYAGSGDLRRPLSLYGFTTDVTAEKNAQRELLAYRDQLEQTVAQRTQALQQVNARLHEVVFALESVGTAIYWIDPQDARILSTNAYAAQMLGYSVDELSRLRVQDINPEFTMATFAQIQDSLRAQGSMRMESVHRRKDGSLVPVEVTVHSCIDAAGQLRRQIAFVIDISDRKAAEQALLEAKAQAEASARIKSDFVANMSHEIRTPMNAVLGLTYLALQTPLSDRQRDYLQKIQDSGQHLLHIVNDILDFSKIEAGRMELERTDFQLEALLEQCIAVIGNQATAKGIELIIEVAADVPLNLVGDPLRLRQILLNYLSNAVKFTHQGEISVKVTLERRRAHDVLLRFAVRDTGIGIEPAHLGRLFNSFEQVDSSTTRQYGGSGLGLPISKRLAEMMGGAVGVRSEPGVGSGFWFTAWLGIGTESNLPAGVTTELQGCRALVIDDSPHARLVQAQLLRNMGLEVVTVESGAEGIAEVAQADAIGRPYEIAFIDWRMPLTDGIEVAAAISRLPLRQAPRRVICSASADEERLILAARAVGVEHLLTKPVTASTLSKLLVQLHSAGRAKPPVPQTMLEAGATRRFAGWRLLLVEDNEINQQVACELLVAVGCEVEVACNGAEAVEQVRQARYDLVLMDMQMPVMDGLEACRSIRALPGLDKLPIIAMTANALSAARESCLDAGMNDYITKPIEPERLWATLAQWLPDREATPTGPGLEALPEACRQTALPPALFEIAGLDAARGLSRAAGRSQLYLSLLSRFVASQKDFGAAIRSALALGDVMTAERQAHTLKGVAAQLGADALSELAAGLEQALQQGVATVRVETMIEAAGDCLNQLIAALLPHLPGAAPKAVAPFDPERFAAVLAQLQQLLAESDTTCQQLLESHADLLSQGLGEPYEAFRELVGRFDFERALQCLKLKAKES